MEKEVTLIESIYLIKPEKMENIVLPEFYSYLKEMLGYDPEDKEIVCDCRYVHISDNIQDNFYSAYKERYPGISEEDIAMKLCISGPMVDRQLQKNSIKILKGFIDREQNDD